MGPFLIFIGGIGLGAVSLLLLLKINEHIGANRKFEPAFFAGSIMLAYWGVMMKIYLKGI
jgi:inner membrane protein involved in colicin E2 resistance